MNPNDPKTEAPPGTPPDAGDIDSIIADVATRRLNGEQVSDAEILARFPDSRKELEEALRVLQSVQAALADADGSSAHPSQASDEAVTQVAGSDYSGSYSLSSDLPGYVVQREIHRGGQGIVYLAVQKSTQRRVAVKVLRGGAFSSSSNRVRFEQEVRILSSLKHPNIVTVHDCGLGQDCAYFVMEYVEGNRLDEFVKNARLSLDGILDLFLKICDAVHVAHLRNIIHRDLKPSNILVDRAGEPHILDFGLAKVSAFDAIASELPYEATVTGQFVGTLQWASPEQIEGKRSEIGTQSDVHSLGLLLYQMITGRAPFEVVGSIRAITDAIVKAPPIRPRSLRPDLPVDLETVMLNCLKKSPNERYETAGDLAADLRAFRKGERIVAPAVPANAGALDWIKRNRLRATIGVSVIAIAALIAVQRLSSGEGAKPSTMPIRPSHQILIPRNGLAKDPLQRALNTAGTTDLAAAEKTLSTALKNGLLPREKPRYMQSLAVVLDNLGRLEEAAQWYKSALQDFERGPRASLMPQMVTLVNLAGVLEALGRHDEAEKRYRDAIGLLRQSPPSREEPMPFLANSAFAAFLINAGRLSEAREHLDRAAGIAQKTNIAEQKAFVEKAQSIIDERQEHSVAGSP